MCFPTFGILYYPSKLIMTPKEFKNTWGSDNGFSRLFPIKLSQLELMDLNKTTTDFFNESGLPDSAAPFLSFIDDSKDIFKGINRLTNQYDFLDERFSKYIVIGSDGNGDPVVINKQINCQIECLNHENGFECRFMNSSVLHLAEFLIIYRDFVQIVQLENGEEAIMNSTFSDKNFDDLKRTMAFCDEQALFPNSFWNEELEMLLINREESDLTS